MQLDLYTQKGDKKGTVSVTDDMFKVKVNEELVHLAVVRQMANGRKPIAHTKQRGEVRGGGRKPWRQKGTGRARFGSTRNPIWRSGGVAFGPRNTRNFTKNMPLKMRRLALFSSLTSRMEDKSIIAIDKIELKTPSTKAFDAMIKKLPIDRNVLIVMPEKDFTIVKSASNLPNVKTITVNFLNVMDILQFDTILFLESSLKKAEELFLSPSKKA